MRLYPRSILCFQHIEENDVVDDIPLLRLSNICVFWIVCSNSYCWFVELERVPILAAEPVGFEPGVVCLCLEVLGGLDCCLVDVDLDLCETFVDTCWLVLKLDVLESSSCWGYSGLEGHYSFVE